MSPGRQRLSDYMSNSVMRLSTVICDLAGKRAMTLSGIVRASESAVSREALRSSEISKQLTTTPSIPPCYLNLRPSMSGNVVGFCADRTVWVNRFTQF